MAKKPWQGLCLFVKRKSEINKSYNQERGVGVTETKTTAMNTQKQNERKQSKVNELFSELKISAFLVLLIAGAINAVGVTMFLAPGGLYDSGISGTAMLLWQLTPESLTLSFFLIVLNIPLFAFGLKKQGLSFTVYSIWAVFVYSLVSYLITDVLPIDVTHGSPIAEYDLSLCAIFGGLISGMGSGITIRYGGAMWRQIIILFYIFINAFCKLF